MFIFSHQMTIQMFHCSTHITPQKEKLWLTFKRDFSAINLKYYECCIEVNMNILDFVFNVPVLPFAVKSTVRQKHIIYSSVCNDDDGNDKDNI